MKIGYLTFGRDDLGYGLALCLDRIKGHEIYRVTPKTAKLVDVLLFSCFWWEHIYLLADFLRKAGIKKTNSNRPRIIVGGFNTFNPIPFMAYADSVVCGDGEEILTDVLNGEDPGLIWRNVSQVHSFILPGHNTTRIELARGCKFKCKFCSVAHLKPYREVPIDEIKICLDRVKTKKVTLFAPDPTLYSKNEELNKYCHEIGLTRNDTDVRFTSLDNYNGSSLPRIGLEGFSERQRKLVGKQISNELFTTKMIEVIQRGVMKGVLFYVILDLPGEKEDDFLELREALIKIGKTPGAEKFTMIFSPNMFMPMPHTGMEMYGINYEKNYKDIWIKFFGRGKERDWAFLMAEKTRIFKPGSRILSMLSVRGGEEFIQIQTELSAKKIINISGGRPSCRSEKELIRVLQKYGGPERYCGPRFPEDDNPWKRLIFNG